MQAEQNRPLILTLRVNPDSQEFFNEQRRRYFPPHRNFLNAHLTLFHQLPGGADTASFLESIVFETFDLEVSGLINLGGGVAYSLKSTDLLALHNLLRAHFEQALILQDKQALRPHITIQNKVSPAEAKALLAELQQSFKPFTIQAKGMDLWTYLGGPWQHEQFFSFRS